jgi:hypothetical protein
MATMLQARTSSHVKRSTEERVVNADFFTPEVFRTVLQDPAAAHNLKSFCRMKNCEENIDFLEKVMSFNPAYWHSSTNEW